MKEKGNNSEEYLSLQKVSKDLFHLEMNDDLAYDKQFEAIAKHIEYLIQYDFNQLLHILYRVDVSEEKIKQALSENKNRRSSDVITQLLIDREKQKRAFRARFSNK
ncbi:MAG: hypothetical protein ACR2MS_06670 [Weeksellaceae bacterium]